MIASSHDKFLHVWDNRKGAYPLRSIEAHDTKIYGLDWNRTQAHALITCSLDKTIRFWNYANENDGAERIINTPFPVWRARHTPFGWGLLAMPQRGDNNLYLYDRRNGSSNSDNSSSPVKSFEGHEGQVKEFLWRARGPVDDGIDNREFQLVSWGADRILRLHALDEETLARAGYEKGSEIHKNYNLTRKNAIYSTFREEPTKLSSHNRSSSSNLLNLQADSLSGLGDMRSGMTIRSRSTIGDGWAKSGFLNTRASLHAKPETRKDLDPISWMKGVKIGKKEAPLEQSLNSVTSPDYTNPRDWEEFESLGEEITHVGTKFSKVDFYEVNVNQRFLKLSMRGIWDPKESSTLLDCQIDFPESYPVGGAPILAIEETALLDKDVLSKLQADVEQIGKAYLEYRRSSLEAVIRYLQGDQTLEDALKWTKQEMESSVTDLNGGEESSSDEEDELGGYTQNQADVFGLEGSGVLNMVNANSHLPLPKKCGAVWAGNGTLVCFFPPKEQAATLVSSLALQGRDDFVKGRKRMLEGFGKLSLQSQKKSKASSLGTWTSNESASDSEGSASDRSSSASSDSSRDISFKGMRWISQQIFETDNFGLNIVDSDQAAEGTLLSGVSVSAAKATSNRAKSIVSIHDFESLLPSKRELAQYSISDGKVAKANAKVASTYGFTELAEIWTILDMVLVNHVALDGFPIQESTDSTQISQIVAKSSELSADKTIPAPNLHSREERLYGPVKWSRHPFGASRLVKNLYVFWWLLKVKR